MKQILEEERLPCGCIVGRALIDGERIFFMHPCSLTCKYYEYVINESKDRDIPIEVKEHL